MGKKYPKPDPLERARQGDEDALEQVLRGVVAPVFDLALHLFRQPVHAEVCTIAALRGLADDVRSGGPSTTPLGSAAGRLLRHPPPGDPPPPGPDPVDQALGALPEEDRRAVLAVLACDLDGDELVAGLGPDAPETCLRALAGLGLSRDVLRDRLDEVASATPLPSGLVDRALD